MRTVGDDVQRGLHSALANWPLILIGVAVQWFLGMLLVVSLVVALIPLIVVGILSAAMFTESEARATVENFLVNHPLIVIYVLLVLAVVLIPLMLIYAFAQAGRCGIFVDAERKEMTLHHLPPRERFNAFDFNRWAEYGRRFWWRIFMVYNVVWGFYSLLLLAVVAIAAVAVWYFYDQSVDALAAGCSAGVVALIVLFITGFVTTIWSQTAVIECLRWDLPAGAACRRGWNLMRARFGRLLLLQCLLLGISVAAGSLLMVVYFVVATIDAVPGMIILLLPIKIAGSLVQSAFGAALGNWYNASFVSASENVSDAGD